MDPLFLLCLLAVSQNVDFDPGYLLLVALLNDILILRYLPDICGILDTPEGLPTRVRRFWIYPKSLAFWNIDVESIWLDDYVNQVTYDRLREDIRLDFDQFRSLVDQIRPHMPPLTANPLARERLPIRKVVAMVLFRFANRASCKIASRLFAVGKSTVVFYTRLLTDILVDHRKLYCQYVGIPRGDRLVQIMEEFEEYSGLPFVMGAIDCTQIRLWKKPGERLGQYKFPSDYWNHSGGHTISLQAVCDSRKRFWSVTCMKPGSQHDSAQFRASSLWRVLHDEDVWRYSPRLLLSGGHQLRPYIVGDSAYPIQPWLMKTYSAHTVGCPRKIEFDKDICRARVKIENAFGLLKNRWQICKEMSVNLQDVGKVAVACCVLHNFVKMNGVPLRQEDSFPALVGRIPRAAYLENRDASSLVRDALFEYVYPAEIEEH